MRATQVRVAWAAEAARPVQTPLRRTLVDDCGKSVVKIDRNLTFAVARPGMEYSASQHRLTLAFLGGLYLLAIEYLSVEFRMLL
jgi:hypothetical protein